MMVGEGELPILKDNYSRKKDKYNYKINGFKEIRIAAVNNYTLIYSSSTLFSSASVIFIICEYTQDCLF